MKRLTGGVLTAVAVLAVLTACGGNAGAANLTPSGPQPTATSAPAPTQSVPLPSSPTPVPTTVIQATVTPVPAPTQPAPTQSAALPASPTSVPAASTGGGDVLALGKEVFEKKAGGVGCQACHGMDAKGVVGPNIRGKTADDIRKALKEVDLMIQTVKNLNDEDIEAVAAYLQYLTTQP